ncbi:MAG: hypothetical protein ACOYN2_05775 [Patescibacteria group bacterium]
MNAIENSSPEDALGPPRSDIVSVGLSSLASVVAGFVGGVFMLVCSLFFLAGVQDAAPAMFPYILSIVAFVAILISSALAFYLQTLIFPQKYRGGVSQATQTFLFSLLLYLVFTPLYVAVGSSRTDFLMMVFVMHVLINILGTTLIVEILSNYRYSLLSVYASFLGFFVAVFASVVFFLHATVSDKILYPLSLVLVLAFFLTTTFRTLFELGYYYLYTISGQDILGNVFKQIEDEERYNEKLAEKTLTTFQ